jgi:spermidine synthase
MKDDLKEDRKVRLIELSNPFPLEPGTLRLIEPPDGFSSEHLDRLLEGTLGHPFVFDSGALRHLFFNTASTQSSMRLDDPDALVTAYTRKMMAFLLFIPAPRHVLMIGLGGGSLAKFCYRRLPQARICVVEINADVIALRKHFAIPADDERFEIIHDDGAAFLARVPVRPDVILIDAFDEWGVAPSLASSDFYRRVSRSLTARGVLVMNLSGEKSRYPVHIENIRKAFAGAVLLVPVEADNNILLFAFKRPRLAELPARLHRRAAELEQDLGLEFSIFLERLRAGQFLGPARGRSV